MKNPWHEIPYGDSAPEMVTAIIEIPKGSKAITFYRKTFLTPSKSRRKMPRLKK